VVNAIPARRIELFMTDDTERWRQSTRRVEETPVALLT
jgi:hypothetical protein